MIELDDLKSRSPRERLTALTGEPETQWFDRKSARVKPDVLARAIVGFANAEGGIIAIGVAGGVPDGPVDPRHSNALRRVPLTHCAPPPRVHFTELTLEDEGPDILLAVVEPGQALHETSAGDAYLRVGDSTMKLNASQREELAYDRGGAQYESRPMPDVGVTDLDPRLLTELRAAMASTVEDRLMLSARSLLTGAGQPTIAAYLLLGRSPGEQMPHAHVRILRHLNVGAGSGARQTVDAEGDIRVEGAIPDVVARALDQVEQWMPRRQALRHDGRFGPTPIVPRDAWLEGLVNAVVHRSYSMSGDHIRIAIFPDRLEIESPGRFPGLVDPTRPLEIARYARNPRIARVCHDLGITQERGEGVRRMFEEMRLVGLVDPIFKQTSGSVRLILHGTPRISPEVQATMPPAAPRVLDVLRTASSPMGTGEIAAAVGLQRPATLRALRALQEAREVVWRGKSAKDPRATWSLPHGS
ncbi:ATP-binding protein [Ornithinimicrobium sp. Y1847]|uniref:ATP-binding protein n=1 Tax=Ornithinimicrobium sp. Y1847 TaxID=3405419 RepID=UPI003B67E393